MAEVVQTGGSDNGSNVALLVVVVLIVVGLLVWATWFFGFRPEPEPVDQGTNTTIIQEEGPTIINPPPAAPPATNTNTGTNTNR